MRKRKTNCSVNHFFFEKRIDTITHMCLCVCRVGGDGIGFPKQDKCWYLLFQCLFNVPSTIYPRRIRNIFSASALIFSFSALFLFSSFSKVVCDDWMQFVHVWCECVFVWMGLETQMVKMQPSIHCIVGCLWVCIRVEHIRGCGTSVWKFIYIVHRIGWISGPFEHSLISFHVCFALFIWKQLFNMKRMW